MTPTQIIAALRVGIKNGPYRFTHGGCFQLYRTLHWLYPQAVPWLHNGHIYTEIDGQYYDIEGSYEELPEGAIDIRIDPMLHAKAHDWDFA